MVEGQEGGGGAEEGGLGLEERVLRKRDMILS